MRESFDNLLRQYEEGKLTRRQVLGAIIALAVPTRVGAQPGRFRARSLNHVNRVSSVYRRSAQPLRQTHEAGSYLAA